jgi:hypothetical protein
VYNSSANKLALSAGKVMKMGIKFTEEIPFNGVVWYPRAFYTACIVWYYLNLVMFHLIPGLVTDGFLKLCRRKAQ